MIIADTGFWLALANQKDHYHQQSVSFLKQNKQILITTWPVMTETCHLLSNRMGQHSLLAFMESYRQGAFEVFEDLAFYKERILTLMQKYKDLPMDLADASLVILAETLEKGLILSTDQRDFKTYRWKNQHPFHNLLT